MHSSGGTRAPILSVLEFPAHTIYVTGTQAGDRLEIARLRRACHHPETRDASVGHLKETRAFRFCGRRVQSRRGYRISFGFSRGVGGNAEVMLLGTLVLISLASEPNNSRKAGRAIRRAKARESGSLRSDYGVGLGSHSRPSRNYRNGLSSRKSIHGLLSSRLR